MKRTKYMVHAGDEVARFSDLKHAMTFGKVISGRLPGFLIEVNEKSGIVGQYQNGETTPEFKAHHQTAFIV